MKKSLLLGFLSLTVILSACGSATNPDIKKQGDEGACEGICPTPIPVVTPVPTPSQNPNPTPSTPPEQMNGLKELQAATGADETLIVETAKIYNFQDLTNLSFDSVTLSFLIEVDQDLQTVITALQKQNNSVKLYNSGYDKTNPNLADEIKLEAKELAKKAILYKLKVISLLKLVTGKELLDFVNAPEILKETNGNIEFAKYFPWSEKYFPSDATEKEVVVVAKDPIEVFGMQLNNAAYLKYIGAFTSVFVDGQCYSLFYYAKDALVSNVDGVLLKGVPVTMQCKDNLFRKYQVLQN